MAMITPAAIRALHTTFSTVYYKAYDYTSTWHQDVASVTQSSSVSNTYGFMARIPQMRQWVGPRVLQNISAHVYTLDNLTYELSIVVDREDWEDHNLGTYSPLFEQMGMAGKKWPDTVMGPMIQANGNGFDGVAMFANNHPLDPAGVQTNTWNLALTAANYATVREAMMAFTGDDGRPLNVMPNLLVVPPQLEREALTIINADIIPSAAGTASESNVLKGSAQVLVIPEFANAATTWYLLDTSKPIKPFVWQNRRAIEFVNMATPNADNVFFNRQLIWGIDGRGAAGMGCWWLAARSVGP